MKTIAIAFALFLGALLQPCLAQSTWERVGLGFTGGLKGAYLINSKKGYVSGTNGVLRSTVDGGNSWKSITVPTTNELWGVYATTDASGDIIYVAGDDGTLLKSTNGGTDWTTQDLKYSKGFTFGIFGYDASNLCVTGGEGDFGASTGVIVTTHNGGSTWNKSTITGTYSFDKSFFINAQVGYAAGTADAGFSQGVLYKTTDGGAHWSLATTAPGGLNSVYCIDENNIVAAGFSGAVVRTTDGGAHWSNGQVSGSNSADPFTHVEFADRERGFITSANGAILKTTDGGATWTTDDSFTGTGSVLWSMSHAQGTGEALVIAVGDGGAIYRLKLKGQTPAALVDPPALDFGTVASGTKDLSFTISAANSLGLRIDTLYIADPANGFSIASPAGAFPINVAMGNPLTVTVTYTSTGAADKQASLIVRTNDPAHATLSVELTTSKGEVGLPTAVLSATDLDFGKVATNTTREKSITLSAATLAGLRVTSFSIENEAIPGTFIIESPQDPLPIDIQKDDPLVIMIRFKPTELATAYADLYITTNAASNPELHITLNGEGVTTQSSVASESTSREGISIETYPNPIALSGKLQVGIPASSHTSIALYDLLGVQRAVIFDGMCQAGMQTYRIDTGSLPNGSYYVVVRSGDRSATREVTLVK
jgi:photosystem II stability/assembly factor-like uncharacterized protein